VSATVPIGITALVPPGRYRESFRVTLGAVVKTFSRTVQVIEDIF